MIRAMAEILKRSLTRKSKNIYISTTTTCTTLSHFLDTMKIIDILRRGLQESSLWRAAMIISCDKEQTLEIILVEKVFFKCYCNLNIYCAGSNISIQFVFCLQKVN